MAKNHFCAAVRIYFSGMIIANVLAKRNGKRQIAPVTIAMERGSVTRSMLTGQSTFEQNWSA